MTALAFGGLVVIEAHQHRHFGASELAALKAAGPASLATNWSAEALPSGFGPVEGAAPEAGTRHAYQVQAAFHVEVLVASELPPVPEGWPELMYEVDATFEATYHLEIDEVAPSIEDVTVFFRENLLADVWPFAHEYVQTASNRMGMPNPALPMKPPRPKEPEDEGEPQPS